MCFSFNFILFGRNFIAHFIAFLVPRNALLYCEMHQVKLFTVGVIHRIALTVYSTPETADDMMMMTCNDLLCTYKPTRSQLSVAHSAKKLKATCPRAMLQQQFCL